MNSKLINQNIINQIQNQELYEKSLFDFMLINSSLEDFQKQRFNININIYLNSNFEGFLYSKLNNSDSLLKKHIYSFYADSLKEPIFFSMDDKNEKFPYTKNLYQCFYQGINKFFTNLKKENYLNINEEKFLINFFLKKDSISFLSEEAKEEIFKVLINQKDYLLFKNSESPRPEGRGFLAGFIH